MLATTHDKLVRNRRARRAIATKQNRLIERRLKQLARERAV
jgi:hypothetical protein